VALSDTVLQVGLVTLTETTSADGPAEVVIIFLTDGGTVAVRNIKGSCGWLRAMKVLRPIFTHVLSWASGRGCTYYE